MIERMFARFSSKTYHMARGIYRLLRDLPRDLVRIAIHCFDIFWNKTNRLRANIAYPFTWNKLGKHIRQVWTGDDPCADSKRAAIFAHYDPHGQIADYVAHYVKALAEAGLRVYFLSNCKRGKIQNFAGEIEKVRPWTCEVIRRRNVGFDIGAYKDGLARIENPAELDGLLFANDSVYGPLFPLRGLIEQGHAMKSDFWGLTESANGGYHIMSYFIYFNQTALASPKFLKFWKKKLYPMTKLEAIQSGEISLTRFMNNSGFVSRVIFPYREIAWDYIGNWGKKRINAIQRKNHRPANRRSRYLYESIQINRYPLHITQSFWRELILKKYPFIKRDLLLRNPYQVGNMLGWVSVIRDNSSYDIDLILDHLQRGTGFTLKEIIADHRYSRPRLSWPSPVLDVWHGEDPCTSSKRAAVFFHYDSKGLIAEYVVHHVKALAEAGLRVYFVSNAKKPKMLKEQIEKIRPWTREIVRRRNTGRDFGGYKDGIARIGNLNELDGLLLVNDTVYGPFFPVRNLIEQGEALQADFWGTTEHPGAYDPNGKKIHHSHLQSYFAYFHSSVLQSPTFQKFWRTLPYFKLRNSCIINGEIRLSRLLTTSGFRFRSIFDIHEFGPNMITSKLENLMNYSNRSYLHELEALRYHELLNHNWFSIIDAYWDRLIECGFPYLKQKILITPTIRMINDLKIAELMQSRISMWEKIIRQHSNYDTNMILDHLNRFRNHKTPDI